MAEDDFFEKVGDFLSRKARNLRDRLTFDETDLIRAVGKNNIDEVERVLAAGVDSNKADVIGRRALAMAVDSNNLSIVDRLLAAGADPNLPGRDSLPLSKAVFWENEGIIEALLSAGAEVDKVGPDGKSALGEAKATGVASLLDLMTNFKDRKRQKQVTRDKTLHAKQKAQAELAKKNKAKVEQQLREKAQAQAQVDARSRFPEAESNPLLALIKAIKAQDEDAIALLLLSVEDLNAFEATMKTTPLLAAITAKNAMATGWLLEKGVDPMTQVEGTNHSGFSQAVRQKAYGLVSRILEESPEAAKAAMNNPEATISPQFMAYKDPRLFNLLLKGGADPFFGGQEGQSPILKALAKGSIGILPVLTRHAVDLNRKIEEKSILEHAIFYNREDWVQGLLAEGIKADEAAIKYAKELGGREAIVALLTP